MITSGKFALPIDAEAVAEDWRRRGFSCHRFVDPPGQEWNDFVHETNELVTVVDGALRMTVAGEAVRLAPGDELWIPRGAVHSVKNVFNGTTQWLFGYD